MPNNNTVTQEDVDNEMKNVESKTIEVFGRKVTFCALKMKNGFLLMDSSTCVDPENYSESIGKATLLEKMEDQVWFLLGYALQDKQ